MSLGGVILFLMLVFALLMKFKKKADTVNYKIDEPQRLKKQREDDLARRIVEDIEKEEERQLREWRKNRGLDPDDDSEDIWYDGYI